MLGLPPMLARAKSYFLFLKLAFSSQPSKKINHHVFFCKMLERKQACRHNADFPLLY